MVPSGVRCDGRTSGRDDAVHLHQQDRGAGPRLCGLIRGLQGQTEQQSPQHSQHNDAPQPIPPLLHRRFPLLSATGPVRIRINRIWP